jgi:hypothetical protein
MHGVDRFPDEAYPEGHFAGPQLVGLPTPCGTCDARERVQAGVKPGMRVVLHEFNVEGVEGEVLAIDPCDGSCCEQWPLGAGPCDNDFVILSGHDDSVFFRFQIGLVDA